MRTESIDFDKYIALSKIKDTHRNQVAIIQLNNNTIHLYSQYKSYIDMFAFVLVLDGDCNISVDKKISRLVKNDIEIISPNMLIGASCPSDDFKGFLLLLNNSYFEGLSSTNPGLRQIIFSILINDSSIYNLSEDQKQNLCVTMNLIRSEILRSSDNIDLIIDYSVSIFLFQTLDFLSLVNVNLKTKSVHARLLFLKFILLVYDNYKKEHNIEFYARELCISKTYLSRIIQKTTEEQNSDTLSRSNKDEAELLINLFENLVETLTPEKIREENIDIGIISPYKNQISYIRHLVKRSKLLRSIKRNISINTVDGFQGQEKDIIMISMVRGNDNGKIGFLNDLRRMNVAITRARMKLIILGDAETLNHHPFYRKLYEYIKENGKVTELEKVNPG